METLLRIGLSNAVAALLLALVVLAVACLWRRPAVLHALWLLVLIKLVTPPLVWLPEPWTAADSPPAPPTVASTAQAESAKAQQPLTAVPLVEPAPDAAEQPLAAEQPADAAAPEAAFIFIADADAAPLLSGPSSPPVPAVAAAPTAPSAPWWIAVVFGLWLAGALAWYMLAVVRLRRFRRLLRCAVPAPESLRQRTQRLAEKLRLRRAPAVWLVPGRLTPMLWAAGGPPRILFPADLLAKTTPEQQNALLLHELAHLRRRDHWVRWLEFIASGLYWWNPVLWLVRRELREAEEHCCDAWVTSTLPGAGKTYAVALLETLDFLSDVPPAAPLLASGVGRVADLKRRLTMIMRGTTPRALGWRGLFAVVGLGSLLLPLLPAWARAQPAPQPKPDAPAKADDPVLRLRVVGDAADDGDKAQDELKELEAKLEQKKAEVAQLAARVAALRTKVGKTDGRTTARFVIAMEGKDAEYADVRKLLEQAAPGAQGVEVIVIDRATGKIIMEKQPNPPVPQPPGAVSADKQYQLRLFRQGGDFVVVPAEDRKLPSAGLPAAPPGYIVVPANPKPPATDADKRLDELEKKLKSILQEVEQLRQERKPGASQGEATPPDGGRRIRR
ncbi:MAG TPA: M56 family metallopeptidase, partial [Gemmataceae bacterium]|nr:M56 family metallopeptidase [Gemmataceae bacterium]